MAQACAGERSGACEPLRGPDGRHRRRLETLCRPLRPGADALGRGKRPSLRSERVQDATDGELAWLLRNGNLARGMPSWSMIPEPSRWQLIAYVKSLGPSVAARPRRRTSPSSSIRDPAR